MDTSGEDVQQAFGVEFEKLTCSSSAFGWDLNSYGADEMIKGE